MTHQGHHCGAGRMRGTRRRGLAPLEFAIALPFFLLLVSIIVMMHDTCVAKARTNILARNAAWSYRHDVAGTGAYGSSKMEDPLGGLLDTVATIDDRVRWFQRGKIHWLSSSGINPPGNPFVSLSSTPTLISNQGVQTKTASLTVFIAPITTMRQKTITSQHSVLGGTWNYEDLSFPAGLLNRPPLVPHFRAFVFAVPTIYQQGYLKYGLGGVSIVQNLFSGGSGLISELTGLAGSTGINPSDPTNGKQADANAKTQAAIDELTNKINDMEDLKRRKNAPRPSAKDWVLHPIDSASREWDIDTAAAEWTVKGGQSALDKYYSTRNDLQNQLNKGQQGQQNPPTF